MARSILRSLTKLRRNRIALTAILTIICIGMVMRYGVLRKRQPVQVELGVSDVLQEPKEDVESTKASEKVFEKTKTERDTAEKSKPTQDKKEEVEEKEAPSSQTSSPSSPVLPNALIIGGVSCGTNPLSDILSLHPNIAMTQEPQQFFTENYDKGVKWYSSMLKKPHKNQHVIIERSPDYLYSREAPERIKKMNSSMKMIVVLRNPVKRLVSEYVTSVLSKLSEEEAEKMTLESKVIDPAVKLINVDRTIIKNGIYLEYLKRWLDNFPRAQIHIVDGDAFIKNPLKELGLLETFLGIPHALKEEDLHFNSTSGYFCPKHDGKPRCYGNAVAPQQLTENDFVTLEKVTNFYRHHNDRLFNLIDQRFEWS